MGLLSSSSSSSSSLTDSLSAPIRSFFASLDDPAIPWKTLVLYLVLAVYAFETYLSLRQYKVYSYGAPPASLARHVDLDTFQKSQRYGRDKARFGFVVGAWGLINSLAVIHFDLLPLVWTWSGMLLQKMGRVPSEIPQSIIFTFLFSGLRATLDLPFSYYSHFVLEEKHGFNKMTRSTFVLDFVKGLGIGAVFLSPLIAGLIAIIRWAGTDGFVSWVLMFILAFQILAQVLYPTVIQPLFNKLQPLEEGPLKSRVVSLANSMRFPLAKIYQIDGSKRSAHSNAYFFGVLPWANKHIVIFDTLIAKSTCSEIEAVICHELGHWKHRDPTKLLLIAQAQVALTFGVFAGFIGNVSLFRSFGFNVSTTQGYLPIIIGLELFQMVLAALDVVLQFGMNSAVRSMEYAADEFAANLDRPAFSEEQMEGLTKAAEAKEESKRKEVEAGQNGTSSTTSTASTDPDIPLQLELEQTQQPYDELLAKALIKLHVQNLSTMHYDPLYSAYHHSHPTLPERLAALQRIRERKENAEGRGVEGKKNI